MTRRAPEEVRRGHREPQGTRIRDGIRRSEERVRELLERYERGDQSEPPNKEDTKKT